MSAVPEPWVFWDTASLRMRWRSLCDIMSTMSVNGQGKSRSTDKPARVAPGVYMLEVPFPPGWFPPDAPAGTLSYLVEQQDGWLLVDSGLNHQTCFDALCRQLAVLGMSLRDIRWLLVTHFHPDHYGLAGRIKSAANPKVIMHRKDWDMIQFVAKEGETWSEDTFVEWATYLGVLPAEMDMYRQVVSFGRGLFPSDVVPDILLEGDEQPVGDSGNLTAILTPGHTPGHVCVYDQRNKILFSGDHVLVGITTNITPSFLGGGDQLSDYLNALRRVQRLDVNLVLPAHEQPFSHLDRRVDELLAHHDRRLEQVLDAVTRHPSSPREIASQVRWTVGVWDEMNGMDRLLAIQETLAHLHLLQGRGSIALEEKDGLSLYTRSSGAG